MNCPRCESDKVDVLTTSPTVDYAEHGEYVMTCECKDCGFEFYTTDYADSPMFGEEV